MQRVLYHDADTYYRDDAIVVNRRDTTSINTKTNLVYTVKPQMQTIVTIVSRRTFGFVRGSACQPRRSYQGPQVRQIPCGDRSQSSTTCQHSKDNSTSGNIPLIYHHESWYSRRLCSDNRKILRCRDPFPRITRCQFRSSRCPIILLHRRAVRG